MFSVSRRTLALVSVLLFIWALLLMPGLAGRHAPLSVRGSIASADASTPRSYVEFIDGAYFGALGRFPTCYEEQAEYDALASATSTGNRLGEARRFVSTLFETQASFNDPGGTYCQTTDYEARNPAFCDPRINSQSAGFITDLYGAFLLRQPDQGGFNDWMDTIPDNGRKVVLNGFRDSTEFGIIVNALFAGERPICVIECPDCDPEPCPGPNNTKPNRVCT
jgi:hypothetical protein